MRYMCLMLLMATSVWAAKDRIEGVLMFEYGDAFTENYAIQRFYLQTKDQTILLNTSQAFIDRMPIVDWVGKRVSVSLKPQTSAADAGKIVQSIELLEGVELRGGDISGPQKWISLLCKFNDITAEPENLNYFQNMYASTPAGLDHYWREVSYNKANVVGSIAVDWVDLPSDHTTYVPSPGSGTGADLGLLFNDCTTAADALVDFTDDFVGINMMFNDLLDCCAWGGGRNANLDGQSQFWRVTWNPPWAYRSIGVIAHEMGHGFGLPHTNNSDEDGDPYDNRWDVMSAATGNAVNDTIYGRLGKHINMYHKYRLGWVSDADGFTAGVDSYAIKKVNWTALATSAREKYLRIPLSDGSTYYIESRQESGAYESNLAGTAVIIHHVVSGRSEPAWVIDADNPPANIANTEGVMWRAGETFFDPIDGYQVEVLAQVQSGFEIRIIGPDFVDLIFADGFE